MPKIIDITGQTFGRLTAIKCVGSRDKRALWRCSCSCGRETIVIGKLLRAGHTKSCGCWNVDINRKLHTVHGGSRTRLSRIWRGMLNRCRNPRTARFKDYGGRGITVCNEWLLFIPFRDWALANGYRDDLSIERRDNDGNYAPDNCSWVPLAHQWRNQRGDTVVVRAVIRSDGKRFERVTDAAREHGITTTNIAAAINRGGTSGGYGWRYA